MVVDESGVRMRRITSLYAGGERRSDAPLVAAVDLALIAGLMFVGQLSHDRNPLVYPLASLESTVPFAVGWLVVAALAGFYDDPSPSTPLEAARTTGVCWLAAANLGFVLRGRDVFAGGTHPDFILVLSGFGFIVLVAWRAGYAALSGTRFADDD